MSTEIENRVVHMKFDNAKFEAGINKTLGSLSKLKESLSFNGVKNGFANVTASANKVDMSHMSKGAEEVRLKFDALQVFAVTALTNISNTAFNAGKNLISAFTIDPIKTGFAEYETQINAVQTILANTSNKGSTLDDVNNALDILNTYADKTIYNFTEMTRNIGTFTAAGVDLNTSVSAIKGIANLAAVSGSTSQQASTAMYQLSQALAAGRVSLQDWNSVVNAGMGGEIFQEELKRTSRVMGTGVDEAINKYGTFRESLTKGAWLTSEVLTATLEKFTGDMNKESLLAKGYTEDQANEILKLGDMANEAATKVKTFSQLMDTLKEAAQSGWTQTWEILVGDFEEAKKMFTSISDTVGGIIGKSAEARNQMLASWKELGGRDDIINGISNTWVGLSRIITAIGEAFREIFPRKTGEQLKAITEKFESLTIKLLPTENAIKSIKMAFKGIFSVIKVGLDILTIPLKFIPSVVNVIMSLVSPLIKVGGLFGSMTSGVIEFTKSGDLLNKLFDTIALYVNKGTDAVFSFISAFHMPLTLDEFKALIPGLDVMCSAMSTAKDKAVDFGKNVIDSFKGIDTEAARMKVSESIQTSFDKIGSMYDKLKEKTGGVVKSLQNVVKSAISNIKAFFEWVDWKQVFQFLGGVVASKFFLSLASALKSVGKAAEAFSKNLSVVADVGESVSGVFDSVKDSLKSWQNSLRAANLMKIGVAIGVISASIWMLSKIEVDKLIPAMAAIGSLFVAITASSILIAKFAKGGAMKGLMGMSVAIMILSKAVISLSALDPVKMMIGVGGIVALISMLAGYSIAMSKMKVQITTGALALIAFSTAILILTAAVLKLTNIDVKDLAVAIGGIIALSLAVATSAKILGKTSKDSSKGALNLMMFASSVKTLAKAVKILADIDPKAMVKGLAGIGAILLELSLFTRLLKPDKLIGMGIGMNLLAVAITGLVVPINLLGRTDVKVLAIGIKSIAIMLSSMAIALRAMPKNLPAIGVGLNLVATSLVGIGAAMGIVGKFKFSTITKSIFAFGVALGGLAITLNLMRGTLGASAALLVASSALSALAVALGLMGALPMAVIAVGLIGFAGALIVLSTAMNSMMFAAPALLSSAAFFLAFSTSLLITATAVGVLGIGLAALATGIASIGLMGATLAKTFKMVAEAVLEVLPIFVDIGIKLIVSLIKGIASAGTELGTALVKIIRKALYVIETVIPDIVKTVFLVLKKSLDAVADNIEPITKNVMRILIGIIRGVSTHLPELVEEAIKLVTNLFSSIAEAVSKIDTKKLMQAVIGAGIMSMVVFVASAILPLIPSAALAIAAMGGLVLELVGVLTLLGGIAIIPGVKWLMEEGGNALGLLGRAVGKFIGGIIGGIAEGAAASLPKIGTYLSEFMVNATPFFSSMSTINPDVVKGVKDLAAATAVMTATGFINDIVAFFKGGKSPLSSFGEELAKFAPFYKQYADTMAGVNGSELEATSNAIKAIAEFADLIPNQGGLAGLLLGDNSLADFAAQLIPFGISLKMYSDSVVGVQSEAVQNASNAAKSIAELADLVPNQGGLASLLIGDNTLADFGLGLLAFGPSLKLYSESVVGVNAPAILNSVTAAQSLAGLAELVPNQGGLASLLVGDNTLDDFGEGLVAFGPSLKTYSDSVIGVNASAVITSVAAALELSKLAQMVPNQGGLLSLVTGDNLLSDFGKEAASFGKYLAKYSKNVKGINADAMMSSLIVAERLLALGSSIANQDYELDDFGNEVKHFGRDMEDFLDDVSDIKVEAVTTGISAIEAVFNMAKNATGLNSDGLATFMNGLGEISLSGIQSFADNFNNSHEIAISAVDGFIDAAASSVSSNTEVMSTTGLNLMTSLASSISMNTPIVTLAINSVFTGLSTMVQNEAIVVKTNMDILMLSIAGSIYSYSPTVSKSMYDMMTTISGIVTGQSSTIASSGATMMSGLLTGINSNIPSVINAFITLCGSILRTIQGNYTNFFVAGSEITKQITNGINSGMMTSILTMNKIILGMRDAVIGYAVSFRIAGLSLMSNLASGISAGRSDVMFEARQAAGKSCSAINDYYTSWYNSGSYLVRGFANGIADYSYLATARAREMAASANRKAREELDIHSPSRVAKEIGKFFVMGFANGISDNMNESTNQSATMADKAKEAITNTLSNLHNIIDSDGSYSPVITPVLDLSNIEYANGLLDNMYTTDIAARVSSISNRRPSLDASGSQTVNNQNATINNTFNITGSNPKEIANEVSRIIQNQVERRGAIWE